MSEEKDKLQIQFGEFEEGEDVRVQNLEVESKNKPEKLGEVILITGKRGSGKTALGYHLLEISEKEKYVVGLPDYKYHLLPDNIHPLDVDTTTPPDDPLEDATIFIDEAALLFSSREYMKNANREIAKLVTQARHKNQCLLFASHTLRKLDVAIVIDTDAIFFKEPSFLHSRFERSEILEATQEARKRFELISQEERVKFSYLVSHDREEMISTPLPSFWSNELSKSSSKIMSEKSAIYGDLVRIGCVRCDSHRWKVEGKEAICRNCGRRHAIKKGEDGTYISALF